MKPPRRPKAIHDDLNSVVGYLIARGLGDDANFAALKCSGDLWEVTFSGAEYVAIAMGDIDYFELHQELTNKRSYNAKLIDGGILQLMYRFSGNDLVQHRLAFFPSPSLRPFQEDPDSYMRDELFLDIVSRRIVPFPLRFDFDARDEVYHDGIHPRSHLTLGDVEGCRIPVTSPVTPRWFIEFVLRNFYQTKERDFVEDLPKHKVNFESSISENEKSMVHVMIPGVA